MPDAPITLPPDQFDALPDDNTATAPSPAPQSFGMPEQAQPAPEAQEGETIPAAAFDAMPDDSVTYGTPGQMWKTFGEGVARGYVSQPVATLGEEAAGVQPGDILGREKANPWTSFAGELTGFGAGAFTGTGEARVLHEIGGGVTDAMGLGKVGTAAVKGLIDAETLTGGDEVDKKILNDPDQTAGSVAAHMGLSAVLGPTFGVIPELWSATRGAVVKNILNFAKSDSEGVGASLAPDPNRLQINDFAKTALNVAFGPATGKMEAYVGSREAIRLAPEFQDVYDHLLGHLQEVGDDVDAQKDILAKAERAFEQQGYELPQAKIAASVAMKDAQSQLEQELSTTAYSKAAPITGALYDLRDSLVDGSSDAFKLLDKPENANQMIPLTSLYRAATGLQEEANEGGTLFHKNIVENIQKQVDLWKQQFGLEATGSQAKSMIMGLDDVARYNNTPATFGNGLSPVFAQLRHELNQTLIEHIPEYGEFMKPLDKATRLLQDLRPYDSPEKALNRIKVLSKDTNYISDMPKLRELEKLTGVKFTHELDSYASPALNKMRLEKLPEYAEAQRAAKALEIFKNPETWENIHREITTDPEWQEAMQRKADISGLTENTLEGKLKSVMTGKNIAARSMLQKLPGLKGMSIPEILDLIAVRDAFEKGATNGSRNVNAYGGIGSTLGGGLGAIFGGPIGAATGAGVGGSIGAIAGATIDKKGPAIARSILDKYIDAYGSLPDKAGLSERAVRRGLRSFLGTGQEPSAGGFKAAADYSENAARGFSDTKKAAKAVFEKGLSVLPSHLIPTGDDLKNLDKRVKEIKEKPHQMYAFGGQVSHYMPRHAESIAKIGSAAVGNLNMLRPHYPPQAPLDEELEPSAAEKGDYDESLQVAQQPLMLLQHIKNGTLLPQHMAIANSIYPHFVKHIGGELMKAMTDHLAREGTIPYHVKQSLSLFHGTPMDSTLSQPNIMAAQNSFAAQKSAPPAPPVTKNKRDTSKLGQAAGQYRTADQAAQQRQSQKG